MTRGFLSGIAMGAVVAVASAVGLSFVIDPPDPPKPDAVALGVPAGSEFNRPREDEQTVLSAEEPAPLVLGAPQVDAPLPDDSVAIDPVGIRPLDVPQTGPPAIALPPPAEIGAPKLSVGTDAPVPQVAAGGVSQPDDPAAIDAAGIRPPDAPQTGQPATDLPPPTESSAPDLSVGTDAPVPQVAAGGVPNASSLESEVAVLTDPAMPLRLEAHTGEIPPALTAVPESPHPSVLSAAPQEPALSDRDGERTTGLRPTGVNSEKPRVMAPPPTKDAPDAQESVIRVDPAPVPPSERIGSAGSAVDDSPADGEETTPGRAMTDNEQRDEPGIVAPPGESESGEQGSGPVIAIGTPASRLTERSDRALAGNRPTIGTVARAPVMPRTSSPEAAAPAPEPPFVKYSAPVDAAENAPRMAIVLIDDPDADVGIEALSTFPYALSFAVDTSRPDAAERMAIYRAAGFEVLALVDLPEEAGAADVEVAMQVLLARVPEAVGVMEAPGDGLQSNREIVTQVTEIVENSGHGLLLYPKGLDTGRKLAVRAGVPAASIFRDFDAKGEKPSVIRRFLNYAALKAGGEENGVVMVGRLRPDTVTALLLWGLEDRARDIALTPVSAVMQAQQE